MNQTLVVRAKVVVAAAGALHTPALLLRSGLRCVLVLALVLALTLILTLILTLTPILILILTLTHRHPKIGAHLALHPVVGVAGVFSKVLLGLGLGSGLGLVRARARARMLHYAVQCCAV